MEQIVDDSRPASLQAERVILGAMLVEPDAVPDAIEWLEIDDFSVDSHRKIYHAMFDMAESGTPIDDITVCQELSKRRQLDTIGGKVWVAGLSEGLPRKLSIESYVRIVRDKSILRKIIVASETYSLRATEQSEEASSILGDMEETILELAQGFQQQAFSTILDATKEAGGVEQFVDKICDPVQMTGLSTGFAHVDAKIGGLQPSEFILLAARPSTGKSAYCMNIACNVVLDESLAVVAVFSLEMSKTSLYRRMLCSHAMVNLRRTDSGFLSREERTRLGNSVLKFAERHLMIDDTASITPVQMRAKCRRLKQRMGRLDLVVIDYIQLMHASKKSSNEVTDLSNVSRALKAMAKELDVPVLALSQLSRNNEQRTGDKRPMLSDLRGSGSLEQDADQVLFIHRPEMYDRENVELKGLAEILIAKNRNGPTGKVDLAYLDEYTRFETLERAHNEGEGHGRN